MNTLPVRHVIFLFHACLQTWGLSREHKRGDGHTPEVQGPATMLSGAERTTWTFCSQAEKCLSHSSSASAVGWSTVLHLIINKCVLNSGHIGCSQPTAMDRHNTEYGRNRREHFCSSYRAHHKTTSIQIKTVFAAQL